MHLSCDRRTATEGECAQFESDRPQVVGLQIINVWLIAENDAFRRLIGQTLLQTPDVVCQQAFPDAEAAVEALKHSAEPDIILLDFQPCGVNGTKAVRTFKGLLPSTPVIILADSAEPQTVSAAILAGASGFLLNTSPLPKIVESIRDVREGGGSVAPGAARSLFEMLRRLSPPPPPPQQFTPQEQKIAQLMTRGLLMKEIAQELALSYHTVDTHLRNIYSKLQVHTRASAVAKVLQDRLI